MTDSILLKVVVGIRDAGHNRKPSCIAAANQ